MHDAHDVVPDPHEWLESEDRSEREARAERLGWLIRGYPVAPLGFLLGGGWLSKQILEEVKYCFTYGQFVAASVLGFSLIERLLAAELYGSGNDAMERAKSVDLLRVACETGRLSADEFALLDRLRVLRNPLVHFRKPLSSDTIEQRLVATDASPEAIVEQDARWVISALFRLLAKHAV